MSSNIMYFSDDTEGLTHCAQFCAELVRQGICFNAGRDGRGYFVEMTGY